MSPELVPQWLRQEVDKQEREDLQSVAESSSNAAAELTINAEAPDYWRQFVKELALATDGLAEVSKKPLAGSVLHRPSEVESYCRVSVQHLGVTARQTYTDLFHTAGSFVVRCHTLGGNAFMLRFTVRPDGRGIGLIERDNFDVMSPEKAAERIVRPMMRWVLGSSSSLY